MKKGQVALFMLLGIILFLISIVAFQVLRTQHLSAERSPSAAPVQNFIEACIAQVGADAIISTGMRGGYYHQPPAFTRGLLPNTAIYLDEGQQYVPTLQDWETALADYMDANLQNCVENNTFAEQGLVLSFEQPKSVTSIGENEVHWRVQLPVTITQGRTTLRIKEFSATVHDIRLVHIHAVSTALVDANQQHPEAICLSCMVDLGSEVGMGVRADRMYNRTFLITINDPESKIGRSAYQFVFGITLTEQAEGETDA